MMYTAADAQTCRKSNIFSPAALIPSLVFPEIADIGNRRHIKSA